MVWYTFYFDSLDVWISVPEQTHMRRYDVYTGLVKCTAGPDCSKLTMSLASVSLKFQTLISEICQYFC